MAIEPVLQAGGVVYRTTTSGTEVLLVKDSAGMAWIFPKGHIEAGETAAQAAQREVCEEAGYRTEIDSLLEPPLEFHSNNEQVLVRYFLMRPVDEVATKENRERRWFTLDAAAKALTHPDARALLLFNNPRIVRAARDPQLVAFMMAELKTLEEAFETNEANGEQRVNTFLALVTGSGALVAFLLDRDALAPDRVEPAAVALLGLLFFFGLLTVRRVIQRNALADDYKAQLARLRRWFLLCEAEPASAVAPFSPFKPQKRGTTILSLGRGGWLQMTAAIQAAVAGTLAAMLVATGNWYAEGVVFVLGAVLAWVGVIAWAKGAESAPTKKSAKNK
jgi:8-oxo-dGTP pyrophosphatase MutT (NUDIX family)